MISENTFIIRLYILKVVKMQNSGSDTTPNHARLNMKAVRKFIKSGYFSIVISLQF